MLQAKDDWWTPRKEITDSGCILEKKLLGTEKE